MHLLQQTPFRAQPEVGVSVGRSIDNPEAGPEKLRHSAETRPEASRDTFATRLEAGQNNIDLLRLLGAVAVLFFHSFILTGVPDAEPVAILFGHGTDLGTLAVGTFFVFSGFLIARSALRSRLGDYARARILRIYPGLIALLLLQTFVLGPAMTSNAKLAYLADPQAWGALLRGLILSPPLGLPGVFAENPVPLAVNGSLWTLRLEAMLWVSLAVLAPLGLLGRGGSLFLLALSAFSVLPAAAHGLKPLAITFHVSEFLAGVALFAWRGAVPHRACLAAIAAVLLGLGCYTPAAPLLVCLTLPYLVLYLGLSRPILHLNDDISYGTYLYAFPIQQMLVSVLGAAVGPWSLTALSLPPTLLFGHLSRRLIERPALRRKHKRHTELRPSVPVLKFVGSADQFQIRDTSG